MTTPTPNDTPIVDVSRRRFVKASSATVGIAALASPALGWIDGDDTIKVGLIGCGGRGTGAAGQAMRADKGAVLWAMGDAFEDRLSSSHGHLVNGHGEQIQVDSERQFVGFDAYQKVIDSGVDVVILTTPPHFRPEQFKYAVDKKKHVFMEKPMAVDGPGVRSVIADAQRAKEQGTNVMGGFCWRYNHPNRECYQRIHDGAIGDVKCVHSTYLSGPLGQKPRQEGWTDMEWQLRNWQHFNWLSGDHIAEQACHAIDKINWAKDNMQPDRCITVGGRQMRSGPESGNIYDHFSVVYEYPDGTRSFHDCRQMPNCWSDNTEKIFGTKGDCYINSWGPTQIITGDNPWEYEGPNPNMYQVEHNELFKAIRNGDLINDGPEMTRSTLMSIMGRMSAYSGQPVTYIEALNSEDRLGPTVYEWSDVPVLEVSVPGSPARWSDVQVASK
ncbi:MAG: Gfo/Idh/MocA family oxidoreductase [Planctomycetota bacterium]|nr:Gfo/Idh/MocA family oxidoreductase [Planctomycetota bacterium]